MNFSYIVTIELESELKEAEKKLQTKFENLKMKYQIAYSILATITQIRFYDINNLYFIKIILFAD